MEPSSKLRPLGGVVQRKGRLDRRDDFASAALTGLLAHGSEDRTHSVLALEAYRIADAMENERGMGL